MSASLTPSQKRLERARQLQSEYQAAIDEYASSLGAVLDFDPATGWTYLALSTSHAVEPSRMAMLLGDTLHNLRSALDYLVWQLAVAAGNQPGDKTSFLIALSEQTWKSNSAQRFAGVDAAWIQRIEQHQPFKATPPASHWLYQLDEMNNYIKHRLVPPSISQVRHLRLSNVKVTAGVSYEFDYDDGPLVDGAQFFRVRASDGKVVELQGDVIALWRVSFDDGKTGEWDLESMLQQGEALLAEFEPAFSP